MTVFVRSLAAVTLGAAATLSLGQAAPPDAAPPQISLLFPGRPAPKIQVGQWLHGQPIDECKAGTIYVFEFFRSRYKPARAFAKTFDDWARKYGGKATFAAFSVFDNTADDAKEFEKDVAKRPNYSLASDSLTAGHVGAGFMSTNWYLASGQTDMPGIVIVDDKQTIAWIGGANNATDPLEKILDRKWDLQAYIANQKAKGAKEIADLQAWEKNPVKLSIDKVNALLDAGKGDDALNEIDTLVTLDPKDAKMDPVKWGVYLRLQAYIETNDLDGFYAAVAQVYDICSDDAMMLNNASWMIVDPKSDIPDRHYDLATKLVLKAIDVDKTQAAYWDTLGWAYFGAGDKAKAIDAEKQAVALSDDLDDEDRYKKVLDQFQGAPANPNAH